MLLQEKNWKVKGVLYDKNTKKPVMNNGKEVTASAKFAPETSEGSVDVTFTFDASDLDGHTLLLMNRCMM